MSTDLVPFRAAIDAGVSSIMAGHLLVPALDPNRPASLSLPILTDMLRKTLGFGGVIMTDAMNMAGVRQGMDEAGACLTALEAGCDLILHPDDPYAAAKRQMPAFYRLGYDYSTFLMPGFDLNTAYVAQRKEKTISLNEGSR